MNNSSPVPELGRVAKGSSLNFFGAISRNIFGFVVVYILTQFLSPNDVGLFFLGMSIVMFIRILLIGGLDKAVCRFISIAHGNKNVDEAWHFFVTAVVLVAVQAFILGVTLFFLADYLAISLFEKEKLSHVIKGLIPFFILYSFAELFLSVTHGYKHMKYWVICLDIINSILRILLVIAFSLLGFGLDGAILSYVIAIVITVVFAYFSFRKVMPVKTNDGVVYKFRALTEFSIPVMFSKIVYSGNGLLETMLLGYFLAASDVGIYTVALKITVIGAIVLSSFNTMFAPIISQMHESGRMDELKELFSCITRWTFSFSLPIFVLIAWFAASIAAIFGEDYISGVNCIVALCFVRVLNALTGASGSLLLMSGHVFINLWTNMVALILSVVLNILFIPQYGILGTALAVGVAMTTVNVIRIVLTIKKLHMHPYDLDYWKPVVSVSVVILALVYVGSPRMEVIGVMDLILQSTISLLLYIGMMFILGIKQTDKYVLNKVLVKFKRS